MTKRLANSGKIALGALTIVVAAFSMSQSARAMQTSQCGWVCEEGASEGGTCTAHYICQQTSIAPQGGFHPVPHPAPKPKVKATMIHNNVTGGNHLTGSNNHLTTTNKIPTAPLTASTTSTTLLKRH